MYLLGQKGCVLCSGSIVQMRFGKSQIIQSTRNMLFLIILGYKLVNLLIR